MGCWNGTCMISSLPILYGEPVKVVILYGKTPIEGSSGYVYSKDIMAPAFMGFDALYNDYGGIKDPVMDTNVELIEKYFNSLGSKFKVEGETVKEKLTIKTIIAAIERNGVREHSFRYFGKKLKNYGLSRILSTNSDEKEKWHDVGFSFVMIRKDIWDSLVNNSKNRNDVFYMGYKDGQYKEWNYIEYLSDRIERFIYYSRQMESLYNDNIKHSDISSEDIIGQSLWFHPLRNANESLGLIMLDEYNDKFLEKDQQLIKTWMEHDMICSAVENLRIGWMIKPGAGSQSSDWENYKQLSQSIIKVCDKHLSEIE